MNTIDFEIIFNDTINRYILYIKSKDKDIPVEILCFENDKEKEKFEKNYKRNKKNIGECFFDNNLLNDEVAINNYNLENHKNDNDDLTEILSLFENKIPKDIQKIKGGWRFLKFRTDKLQANFITTYRNIKTCIKENLQMNEIVETVEKNSKIELGDLGKEGGFMSALIWKKYFKKAKKPYEDDDDIFNENDNNQDDIKLLNRKRNFESNDENNDAIEIKDDDDEDNAIDKIMDDDEDDY